MRAAESQPCRKESFKGRPLSSSLNCRLNVARATNTRRLAYATNQPVLSYYIMHYYLLIELLSVLTSLDPIPVRATTLCSVTIARRRAVKHDRPLFHFPSRRKRREKEASRFHECLITGSLISLSFFFSLDNNYLLFYFFCVCLRYSVRRRKEAGQLRVKN